MCCRNLLYLVDRAFFASGIDITSHIIEVGHKDCCLLTCVLGWFTGRLDVINVGTCDTIVFAPVTGPPYNNSNSMF